MMTDEAAFRLALVLAALAGWVDAAGLSNSGSVFLSFMSGNTTELAVSVTRADWAKAKVIIAVLALFVAGVAVGEITEPLAGRRGHSLILALEALFLAAGAALHWPSVEPPGFVSLYPVVFAMGLQNATMHRAGGISIGLTYVTGTLVQIGRAAAGLIRGNQDRQKIGKYLALWPSLAVGAGLGAIALSESPFAALAAAAAIAGSLATITAFSQAPPA